MKIKSLLLAASVSVLTSGVYASCPTLNTIEMRTLCRDGLFDKGQFRIFMEGECPEQISMTGTLNGILRGSDSAGGAKCSYQTSRDQGIETHIVLIDGPISGPIGEAPIGGEEVNNTSSPSGLIETPITSPNEISSTNVAPPPPPPPPPPPSMNDASKKGELKPTIQKQSVVPQKSSGMGDIAQQALNVKLKKPSVPVQPTQQPPSGVGNLAQQALNVKLKKPSTAPVQPKTQQPSSTFDLKAGLKKTEKGLPQEMPGQNTAPPSSVKPETNLKPVATSESKPGVVKSISNFGSSISQKLSPNPVKNPPVKKLTVAEIKKLEEDKNLITQSMTEERKKLNEINKKLNEGR